MVSGAEQQSSSDHDHRVLVLADRRRWMTSYCFLSFLHQNILMPPVMLSHILCSQYHTHTTENDMFCIVLFKEFPSSLKPPFPVHPPGPNILIFLLLEAELVTVTEVHMVVSLLKAGKI